MGAQEVGVERLDGKVVPDGDAALEDAGKHARAQLQRGVLQPRQGGDDGDGAEADRHLHKGPAQRAHNNRHNRHDDRSSSGHMSVSGCSLLQL